MRFAVLAGVLAAAGGVVVARHFGASSGTQSSPNSPPTDVCPATAVDACATTVAARLGLDVGEVPTVGALPAGLRYERGRVVKASNGREHRALRFPERRKPSSMPSG